MAKLTVEGTVLSPVIAPWVGFSPITPVNDAGILNDPPASLPVASGTKSAAILATAPPEEPPVLRFKRQGLCAVPFSFEAVTLINPNSG